MAALRLGRGHASYKDGKDTAYKDRELLRAQFNNFCEKHPEGHITKKDFRAMMRTCYPGR